MLSGTQAQEHETVMTPETDFLKTRRLNMERNQRELSKLKLGYGSLFGVKVPSEEEARKLSQKKKEVQAKRRERKEALEMQPIRISERANSKKHIPR